MDFDQGQPLRGRGLSRIGALRLRAEKALHLTRGKKPPADVDQRTREDSHHILQEGVALNDDFDETGVA